jgi:hypothetical protein
MINENNMSEFAHKMISVIEKINLMDDDVS